MSWILEIAIGIAGTGILAYLCWFLFLLHSKPWELWRMNQLGRGIVTLIEGGRNGPHRRPFRLPRSHFPIRRKRQFETA